MRVFVLTILFSSLVSGDLKQREEPRVHISEGAGNLRIQYRAEPKCPYNSCTKCGDAVVNVKLVVGESGSVKQVTVVRTPDRKLADAAENAIKQWRYKRYLLNGSPVEYETYTTIKSWVCGT